MKKKYSAVDLFCGAGGLTVGLKRAGFEVLAGVEIDAVAAETYRLNNEGHILYETDICDLCPKSMLYDLGLKKGDLDLLAGCPPCQGFSTHRTRNKSNSVEDARNDLVLQYLRFVEQLLPKTVMMENVPGLFKDIRMKIIKDRLVGLGYKIDSNSIAIRDASDFGVPQRRRRLILMASRHGFVDVPEKKKEISTVRNAISHLREPGESGDPIHDWVTLRSEKVKKIISLVPKNGGSRSDLPKEYWLDCHLKNPDGYRDVYGRMAWDDVAPTITGGCHNPSKGRFLHPEKDRAITLREASLLQTFPPRYKFSASRGKDAVALMIGNALPPQFIKAQAEVLVKHLRSVEVGDDGIRT